MEKQTHLNILDSLRGIAATCVCLFHFTHGHLPKLTNHVTKPLFIYGGSGVFMFFVISGFIIPFVLNKANYSLTLNKFSEFLLKRFVRINPPSYILLLLVVIQWKIIDTYFYSPAKYIDNFTIKGLLANLLYVAPFLNLPWFEAVFWTLAVEFQYYFFIALFYSLIFKNNFYLIATSFLLSIISLLIPYRFSLANQPIIANLFFTYYPIFAIGFLTFHYKLRKISGLLFYLFLSGLLIITYIKFNLFITTCSAITALVIIYLELRSSVLEFLGKISYSLYLTHMLAGSTLEGIIKRIVILDTLFEKIIVQLLIFVLSILVAYLFYSFVEKPFIRISNIIFKSDRPKEISVQAL